MHDWIITLIVCIPLLTGSGAMIYYLGYTNGYNHAQDDDAYNKYVEAMTDGK